jgi:carbon storage regulator CsrA
MLGLTLKPKEPLYIGDNIRVIIYETFTDGSVKIGIDAPWEIPVVRASAKNKQPRKEERP